MTQKKSEQMVRLDAESTKGLAEAMTKLAEAVEHFLDPLVWQHIMRTAVIEGFPAALQQPLPTFQGLPVGQITAITVSLSAEERETLSALIFDKLQPQLVDFGQFIKESLRELPAARLKALAEKVEAGVTPRLTREKGCVFVAVDGEKHYLGL